MELFALVLETGINATSAIALYTEAWAIVCEVMRVLSARDQAGTLLPGTLRAEEVVYAEASQYARLRVLSAELPQEETSGTQLKYEASLWGYHHLMLCAQLALGYLSMQTRLVLNNSWPLVAGAEVEAAQTFVLRVLALMAEVQLDSSSSASLETLVYESQLVTLVAATLSPERGARIQGVVLTAQFYEELFAAWNTPALQAALRSRRTLDYIQAGAVAQAIAAEQALQAADVAAVGLHACALPACGAREVTVHQFKRCGGCKAVVYCSAECAKAHWKAGHKRECSRGALPAQPNK